MKTLFTLSAVLLFICPSALLAQSPQLVFDINTGSGDSKLQYITEYNGKLYFQADDGVHGIELWATDGTQAGTAMVKDINPGSGNGDPKEFKVYNGKLYFQAFNNIGTGEELWVTDGTAAGTLLVKNISPDSLALSAPRFLTVLNGKLYFSAQNNGLNGFGTQLYVSDGTDTGTKRIFNVPVGGFSPGPFTILNNKLIYPAFINNGDYELWMSDGTDAGTNVLKDIHPSGSSSPLYLTEYNGEIYFQAKDLNGTELWKTDGTTTGTSMVKEIYPFDIYHNDDSDPKGFIEYNGLLYFIAHDPVYAIYGYELWRTNGTAAGTQLVMDHTPGTNGGVYPELRVYRNRLYFGGNVPGQGTGSELWSTDGTPNGTQLVKLINLANNVGSYPQYLHVYNDRLFFIADDGTSSQNQLWATDGTEDSTFMIAPPGAASNAVVNSKEFINFNGSLYFRAKYGASTGLELYKLTMPPPVPTGINHMEGILFSVNPNPVKNDLTVSFKTKGSYELKLVTIKGELLFSSKIQDSKAQIDLSEYPTGMYFLHITDSRGYKHVEKIVKQ